VGILMGMSFHEINWLGVLKFKCGGILLFWKDKISFIIHYGVLDIFFTSFSTIFYFSLCFVIILKATDATKMLPIIDNKSTDCLVMKTSLSMANKI
jgi:hypothetical protein